MVQAQVSFPAGGGAVALKYRYLSVNTAVPPGPMHQVTMSAVPGQQDLYSATVDASKEAPADLQGTSGTVEYTVVATDAGGQSSASPTGKAQVQNCPG
jgi:hypothetical protein